MLDCWSVKMRFCKRVPLSGLASLGSIEFRHQTISCLDSLTSISALNDKWLLKAAHAHLPRREIVL
jgi:hypothetical protein